MSSSPRSISRAARSCAAWASRWRCRCSTRWCRRRRRSRRRPPSRRSRLGFCFMPHGAVMANWTPGGGRRARALADPRAARAVQEQMSWSSATWRTRWPARRARATTAAITRAAPAVFLNGVHPKRTDGADIQAGITIDQIAAEKIGQDTPLPSLELATEDYSGLVGSCDVGFSCTYMNTISWRTPTTPHADGDQPARRVRPDVRRRRHRRGAARRIEQQRSILDAVTGADAASAGRARARAIAIASPNISTPCAKSSGASSWRKSRAAAESRRAGVARAAFPTTSTSTRS